jgi:hypothetical protein
MVVVILPSFMLWSSAALKEALVVPFLFIGFGLLLKYLKTKSYKDLMTSFFWMLPLIIIKPYLLLAALPFYFLLMIPSEKPLIKYLSGLLSAGVLVLLFDYFLPTVKISEMIISRLQVYNSYATSIRSGSLAFMPDSDDGPFALFRLLPYAVRNSFFKPLLWESVNPFYLLSATENILLILFAAWTFFHCRYKISGNLAEASYIFIFFSLIIYLLIGYTNPVIGSVVRFKSSVTPILVTGLILLNKKCQKNLASG